jgi:hypothetical protein
LNVPAVVLSLTTPCAYLRSVSVITWSIKYLTMLLEHKKHICP